MIDTHCHLNIDRIYEKIELVLKEAKEANVNKIIVPGFDLESSKLAIEIAKKYDNCYAAIGFHPTEIKGYDKEYAWLEAAAKEDCVVAIGECGFDFHWDTTTKEEQIEAFVKQIEIAKKVKKPLIIHAREANQITFDTLKKHDACVVGGVLHAYAGSLELAKEYTKMNFCFGIGGVITFKNAASLPSVVKEIDLKYLITETDSPYITPVPFRGKENAPKYIPYIVEKIASIKEIEQEEVIKQVQQNVLKLFKI